jgi:alpha-tubulin suppressor-like RCC1 family protein
MAVREPREEVALRHFRTGSIFVLALVACTSDDPSSALPKGVDLAPHIEPAEPTSRDSLTVLGTIEVDWTVRWYLDGTLQTDLAGERTVPAERVTRGQTWRAEVSAGEDAVGTAQVTVGNAVPIVTVSLSPTDPLPEDDLVATVVVDDPDDEAPELSWTWTRDGRQVAGLEDVVPATETYKGERWEVSVVARDGRSLSDAATAAVEVANTGPVVTEVTLTPNDPRVTDTIVAQATGVDPDGDPLTYLWRWTVDGQTVPDVEGPELPAGLAQRDAVVVAYARPSDGDTIGFELGSAPVTVRNSLPVVTAATVTPADPRAGDTVQCTPATLEDADGDVVSLETTWLLDGIPVIGANLDGRFTRGDVLTCTIVPHDGLAAGAPAVTTVTVANTRPTVSDVALTPAAPTTADTIHVQTTLADADGDPLTWTSTWTVNGTQVATGDSLPPGVARRGDRVEVTVLPNDGLSAGSAATADVLLLNAAPVVGLPTLPAFRTADTPTATLDVSDADGDDLTITWTWTVDGVLAQQGPSATLEAGTAVVGQRVEVSAEVSDGFVVVDAGSAASVVLNTPPTVPTAGVTPSAPVGGRDDLQCVVAAPATDADGQDVDYLVTWLVDGGAVPASITPTTTTLPGDTIPGTETRPGDVWTCQLVATDGEGTSPTALASTSIVSEDALQMLAPGAGHTCALDRSGRLQCWGDARYNQTAAPSGTDWSAVVAGQDHSCALDADGEITCWGRDAAMLTPPPGPFVDVATGVGHACAVDAAGDVTCWGNDTFGQASPPDVALHDLTAGLAHTCGLDDAGTIHCWGTDIQGVLQAPATPGWQKLAAAIRHTCALDSAGQVACWGDVPAASPAGTFVDIGAGDAATCGLRDDGSVLCWGAPGAELLDAPAGAWIDLAVGQGHACVRRADLLTVCWGDSVSGQADPPLADALTIAAGTHHACALTVDGVARCWGDDTAGQASAPDLTFSNVQTGADFSCGLDDDLTCWGADDAGQSSPPAGDFVEMALGETFGCALDGGGQATCWGDLPATPPSDAFVAIAAGTGQACGLDLAGRVTCWGANVTQPTGTFLQISVGADHACGIRRNGDVGCWGYDTNGAHLPPPGAFVEVVAGDGLTCALDTHGQATCWGQDTWDVTSAPVVPLVQLDVEGTYACGVDFDGTELCWGRIVR